MSKCSQSDNLNLPDFSALGNVLVETLQKYQVKMQPITATLQMFIDMTRPMAEAAARFRAIAPKLAETMRPITAINRLGEAQYVYWDFIPQDFMDDVFASVNINKTLQAFERKNKFKKSDGVISKCLQHPFIIPSKRVFKQTVEVYHNGQYDLAVIGLIAVIDNVLSEASSNFTHKSLDRCEVILDKIEKNDALDSDEYAILALELTFQAVFNSLYKTIPFSDKEPVYLNRNWIMHGRAKKKKTRLDCIKLIYFLYGIILIDELSSKEAGI